MTESVVGYIRFILLGSRYSNDYNVGIVLPVIICGGESVILSHHVGVDGNDPLL